jgi:rhamnose utilization protein RhaD (predicted bifunctional aldolase and dehydrogenase)
MVEFWLRQNSDALPRSGLRLIVPEPGIQYHNRMSVQIVTELSREYGANPDYVIAGGGNTSFKDQTTLYIKGSGTALADMTPERFVRLDRSALSGIWDKRYPENPDEREAAVLADMMAAREPGEEQKRPSVETLLHDILPFAYVVHTHPALVNGLTCSRRGESAARELFEGETIWIPATNPGYILSRRVKDAQETFVADKGWPASIILLQNHGIFVAAESPESVRELYRFVMETIGARITRRPDFSGAVTAWGASDAVARVLAELAGEGRVVFARNAEIAALVQDRASFQAVASAFSPDHIVYSGSDPLFIDRGPDGGPLSETVIREAWERHSAATGRAPKIAAVQGLGVFAVGRTEPSAARALDLFHDAVKVAVYTECFGGPCPMTRDQIDFINNWEVERYRSQAIEQGR